jgi:orotate phosphoribosyltransferase-like protein
MTGEQQKLYKAIVTNVAANLIDQLVLIMDDQGIDIDPIEINIEGIPAATMTTKQITAQLRQISNEFRPISVTTTSQDNTA